MCRSNALASISAIHASCQQPAVQHLLVFKNARCCSISDRGTAQRSRIPKLQVSSRYIYSEAALVRATGQPRSKVESRCAPNMEAEGDRELRGNFDPWFASRDWEVIARFWRQMVRGEREQQPAFLEEGSLSLAMIHAVGVDSGEFLSDSNNKRQTFALRIGYVGRDYHGFQLQKTSANLLTVESDLVVALGHTIKNACGRTDAGVSALSQCVSFTTFDKTLRADDILRRFNSSEPVLKEGRLRAFECCHVPRRFHAMYGCLSRRYVYLIPLVNRDEVDVSFINIALQNLEKQPLPFSAFAYGEVPLLTDGSLDEECTLFRAYASLVDLQSGSSPALCIVLCGNRFLRRMVRSVVATVCREAAAQPPTKRDPNILFTVATSRDRRLAAFPAPAEGLCLAGAHYDEKMLDHRQKIIASPAKNKASKVKSTRSLRRAQGLVCTHGKSLEERKGEM